MMIGSLVLEIHIPDSSNLKEKRMVVKSIKEKLRSKFNVAVSEVDKQDLWQSAVIAVVTVAPNKLQLEKVLGSIVGFIDANFPHLHINIHKEII